MNTQDVRLMDVFLLGPLMLYFASQGRLLSREERIVLGMVGLGTILYNARGWLLVRESGVQPDSIKLVEIAPDLVELPGNTNAVA